MIVTLLQHIMFLEVFSLYLAPVVWYFRKVVSTTFTATMKKRVDVTSKITLESGIIWTSLKKTHICFLSYFCQIRLGLLRLGR